MLLSPLVRSIVMYGSLAVFFGAAAFVVMKKPRGKRLLVPAVVGFLALFGTWWAHRHSIDVLLVVDGPKVERKLASSIDIPIAAGAKDELANTIGDSVWLINDSSTTVRVETVWYGDHSGDDPPIQFPPHTGGIFYSIDFIGPTHEPPSTATGLAMLGSAWRTWLTW